ncbi:bifunctional demethylmenaquinone methyltransferase/2-methoxy-6-polyprenyl-1,4-benzoquinol methylase UbiE [Candidatus Paracaedibacter symbiosus]|uniref:bifunctional demethylmenaquinone methyltransferase/2-methoxy-6-polyprenyl-1,4-benzoquinol methylase UbiE n=1 Tax=Candidatus Paracaedibacter symbiosus TaxID=244582 RepID=UPI00069142FD|nr:bifunctional demethylmenaquinone methyltransferase/2-methoxy-6-polyprenyl-1,4-benzoquinol methylase UbiE [Candidatus Paracaedibacter symbiosus]
MSLTDFGFQKVDPKEKTKRVRGVFESVARNYDIMNDLMSLGIHRLWKQDMVKQLPLQPKMKILDVAGGTGDISFLMQEKYRHLDLEITICDLTPSMLEVGRDRAVNKGLLHGIDWVCGNAEQLPIPENSVDLYTIAFGLRNVTHIEVALKEAHRVLKPGGVFACLEFSNVKSAFFSKVYEFYSFSLLPWLGEKVADDRESYQYLVESIRRFPAQEKLALMLKEAGMQTTSWQNLMNGISCLHIAKK